MTVITEARVRRALVRTQCPRAQRGPESLTQSQIRCQTRPACPGMRALHCGPAVNRRLAMVRRGSTVDATSTAIALRRVDSSAPPQPPHAMLDCVSLSPTVHMRGIVIRRSSDGQLSTVQAAMPDDTAAERDPTDDDAAPPTGEFPESATHLGVALARHMP